MSQAAEAVVRSNPHTLPTSLKEAVVDALLNITHARISGAGEEGRFLFGARPRAVLNSGFLLPRRDVTGDDEVTSPIWISSHGLDMQVAAAASGEVLVIPELSIYVRVLPTVDDLKRLDCRPHFRLRREVSEKLKNEAKAAQDLEWEKVKGTYTSRWKHPGWADIRDRVRREVYAKEGVPPDLTNLFSSEDDTEEGVGQAEGAPEAIEANLVEGFKYKDEHFEPLAIPHKWMRIDVEVPPLRFSPYWTEDEISRAAANHASSIKDAIGSHLLAFYESSDPVRGGKLWAYRRTAQIRPSEYKDWTKYLETVREAGGPVAAPAHDVAWNIEVSKDWLDPTRLNLRIGLENVSREPATQVDEQDHAIFLVSLTVEVGTAIHRPLKLERVEPSYRYNAHRRWCNKMSSHPAAPAFVMV
jgi:hypothetical protein